VVCTCSTQGGFCCLFSRAGNWITTHPPKPAVASAGSSTGQRATATHAASILHSSHQHIAGPPSPDGTRLHACWRPAKAFSGPLCRPIPGGLQGGQVLHHPGGQLQETNSVDRLKAHTRPSPVSPAQAASCGRPPKQPPLLRSSLHHHESADWGGPLWRIKFQI
jgi:hypothetical protein